MPLALVDDQFGQKADQEEQHADDGQDAGGDEDGALLRVGEEVEPGQVEEGQHADRHPDQAQPAKEAHGRFAEGEQET